jgi:hypothetical protein
MGKTRWGEVSARARRSGNVVSEVESAQAGASRGCIRVAATDPVNGHRLMGLPPGKPSAQSVGRGCRYPHLPNPATAVDSDGTGSVQAGSVGGRCGGLIRGSVVAGVTSRRARRLWHRRMGSWRTPQSIRRRASAVPCAGDRVRGAEGMPGKGPIPLGGPGPGRP